MAGVRPTAKNSEICTIQWVQMAQLHTYNMAISTQQCSAKISQTDKPHLPDDVTDCQQLAVLIANIQQLLLDCLCHSVSVTYIIQHCGMEYVSMSSTDKLQELPELPTSTE